jgi:hypothetical protein
MKRRRPSIIVAEPSAWVRTFVAEDWIQPDEPTPAGLSRDIWLEQQAFRRWFDARQEWARDTGFPLVEWTLEYLKARRLARRAGLEGVRRYGHLSAARRRV